MMSIATLVLRLALASIIAPAFHQGGQVLAGWRRSASSVVPVQQAAIEPEFSIEPELKLTTHMAKVQDTLQNMESKPLCSRLAHKTLLNACGTYKRNADQVFGSTNEAVETYRDLFSIQLTACGIDEAQQEVPSACQPLLRPLSHDPRRDISNCKKSLHDTINYWTSYENNKHQGQFLCYAWRAQIDQTDQLETMQGMYDALKGMGIVMEEKLKTMDQLKQMSEDLGLELRRAFDALQAENEKMKAEIKQSFNDVAKGMSNVNEGVSSLLGSVSQVDDGLQQHNARINEIFGRLISLTTDVDTWSAGVVQARDEYENLQAMMQMEYQQYLADVFKKVYELTADVSRANDIVSSFASQVDLISNGLDVPLFKVQGISTAADETQQKLQSFQTQFDDMASQANITQEKMQAIHEGTERLKPLAVAARVVLDGLSWFVPILMKLGGYYLLGAGLVMAICSQREWKLWHSLPTSLFLGYPIGCMVIMPLIPLSKPVDAAEVVSQDDIKRNLQLVFYGICIGTLIGVAISTAITKFRNRSNGSAEFDTNASAEFDTYASAEYDPNAEYDPASPGRPTVKKCSV